MEKINFKEILKTTIQIGQALSEGHVRYLISGSLAYKLLTNDPDSKVNDVDIIVSDKDFNNIEKILTDKRLPLKLYLSPYSIHANHTQLLGDDNKPFDWSLDSYEHYYQGKNQLTLDDFANFPVEGSDICLITKEGLIKVYQIALTGSNVHKYPVYRQKITRLETLTEAKDGQ